MGWGYLYQKGVLVGSVCFIGTEQSEATLDSREISLI